VLIEGPCVSDKLSKTFRERMAYMRFPKMMDRYRLKQKSPLTKDRVALFSLVFVAVVIRMRNLDSPLTGSYTFRTTQTAWGIRSVARGELSPFRIETPVLGPPWRIPFEFPLYQMISGLLSRLSGMSVEVSGRLVSLTFFILAGLVLLKISRMFISTQASTVVFAIYLFNSHNLEYGSSVLIEYCAVFFSLLSFYLALRFCKSLLKKHLWLFFAFGSVAALVKITTSTIWVLFGACIALWIFKIRNRNTVILGCVAFATHIPSVLWTMWADHQKSMTFYTEWLTSEKLRTWNFGTLEQRFSYTDWHRTFDNIFFPSVLGSAFFAIVLLIVSISFTKDRRATAAFISLLFIGPFMYTNLYFVHDYYWTAVLPALLLAVAPAFETFRDFAQSFSRSKENGDVTLGVLVALALIISSWFSTYGARHFDVFVKPGSLSYNGDEYQLAIEEIQKLTPKEEKIIVIGNDWDPRLLYFSDRRGLMILDDWDPMKIVAQSEFGSQYKFIYAFPPGVLEPDAIAERFIGVEIHQIGIGLYQIENIKIEETVGP